jgi:hypothetical protein
MMKKVLATSLMILIAILMANVYTKSSQAASAPIANTNNDLDSSQPADVANNQAGRSCANPAAAMAAPCQAMEEEILASTVRLLMFTPIMHVEGEGYRIVNSMGHATVMDGRYLVTHNHYDETILSMLLEGDPDNLITVNIYNSDGEIISQVPGQTLKVLLVERETVVYDLGEIDGIGYLTTLGFPSAKMLSLPSVALEAGMEVAQIDWDGSSTHVDWVRIDATNTQADTPIINVSNCILKGASGGGVYWQGQHIGNNWSRTDKCDSGLDIGDEIVSTVALNSQTVIAP